MTSKGIAWLLPVLLLSGCAIWDAGYTENKPVTSYRVSDADRVPITYSVSMKSERSDVFALPDQKGLCNKIENALRETGMFSEIQYGAKRGTDSYHIEFSFHQAGTSVEDSIAIGLLAGYTFLLVPTGEVFTFDGTAVLSLQGKPIYSSAKAEEIRCLIWLPMAPLGLFMNSWTVWHFLEKGSINALCESIAEEHKRRFLNNADIAVIEKK